MRKYTFISRATRILPVLLALACARQSDEAKMKELRSEQLTRQQIVDYWEHLVDSYPAERRPQYAVDSLSAARIRLDLANRDLNRFMH